jgi:hypothetical protein
MATLKDLGTLKDIMAETMDNPNICKYLGNHVKIHYCDGAGCWSAEFDCDLSIYFDDAEYNSNDIILKRNDVHIARFCHTHQKRTSD